MADPMLTGDFFLGGFPIKSEPISSENNIFGSSSSAGVPIPQRRGNDLCDQRDFAFDMTNQSSGIFPDNPYTTSAGFYSNQSVWSPKSDIKMEDDDIFQVDKADLIQGPTLAELNANDDTLLEDLNFDDLVLPEEAKYLFLAPKEDQGQAVSTPFSVATSFPPPSSGLFFRDLDRENRTLASSLKVMPMKGVIEEKPVIEELEVAGSVGSPVLENTVSIGSPAVLSPQSPGLSPCSPQPSPVQQLSPRGVSPHKPTTLQSLLMKNSMQGGSVGIPGRSNSVGNKSRPSHISRLMAPVSRLSSSAPTHLSLDQLWQRREPRPHLLSTSSLAEATSTSSISTGILSPEAHEFSFDEGFDSEDDTDHDEDDSSDADSSDGEGGSKSGKKDRYFWQYNVQAKGPKGQRLILRNKLEDPHCLDEVTDPVFSPGCSLQGIKHSGKARKGDGNDLTPNPKKLSAIGKELDKLAKTINDMTPVNELPFDIRQKSRKEKNKLASRACRLKKKAQHEANKIKLFGLENEHRRLMAGIHQMKLLIISRVTQQPSNPPPQDPAKVAEKIVKQSTIKTKNHAVYFGGRHCSVNNIIRGGRYSSMPDEIKIAGQTTEFVNRTLDRLKAGIPCGGLDELQHHPT